PGDAARATARVRLRPGDAARALPATRRQTRRPAHQGAGADTAGALAGDAQGTRALMAEHFDPYTLLGVLERQRVHYVVIGALGRVLHGTDEITDGLDIVPYIREENLQRLETALGELHARHPDG